jgi:cytochrome c oxidase assembly protein subunit 23
VTPDFDLAAFENKERTRFMDPCAKQSQASFRCLEENFGDRDKCMDYFQAYRDCKKIWASIVSSTVYARY